MTVRWDQDRFNYPYIWVEPIELWVQFFPVSKLQYELFLVQNNKKNVDYEPLLELNPRISIRKVEFNNYENLFISGILVDEVKSFMEWLDPNNPGVFDANKWREAYSWLSKIDPVTLPKCCENWDPSILSIWKTLNSFPGLNNLAQQMLMENGLLEWVEVSKVPEPEYGGMGTTRSRFSIHLRNPNDAPVFPINSEDRSILKAFGFRAVLE